MLRPGQVVAKGIEKRGGLQVQFQHLYIGVAAGSSRRQAVQVILPALCLLSAQLVQVGPGEETSVMAIVEHQLQGVITHGFDGTDPHVHLTGLQYLLPGAVTAYLCRRGVHSQVFAAQRILFAASIFQFQLPGTAVQFNTDGSLLEAKFREETMGDILRELRLLNHRFEEAFRTGIKLEDIENELY